jgi:hypothetical protein
MTNIEYPMICIRLYREGGRYVESANHTKKEYKKGKRRKRKREDTCTIADEQPSTLAEPDFRKVSPQKMNHQGPPILNLFWENRLEDIKWRYL